MLRVVPSWNKKLWNLPYPIPKDWDTVNNNFVCVLIESCNYDMSDSWIIEVDNFVEGYFKIQEFSTGSSFVSQYEIYWTCGYFQYLTDAKKFKEKFDGYGTWEKEYDLFESLCNTKRNYKFG